MDKRLGGFTQVSAPLCLEVKTYSCFLLLRVPTLRLEESACRLQPRRFATLVSWRSRLFCELSIPDLRRVGSNRLELSPLDPVDLDL